MADTEFGANLRRLTEVAKGRGLEPVLVLLRDKAAFEKGWPELRPSASRALAHVRKDPKRNAVGIQPSSLGCVALDCDEGEGPEVAAEAIRDLHGDVVACVTPSTSGAKNKGHVWVRCDDPYAVGNWKFRVEDPIEGGAAGEIRSTGQVRLNDRSVGMILKGVLGDEAGETATANDLASYRTSAAAEIDADFDRSAGREVPEDEAAALSGRLEGPDAGSRFEHLFALSGDLKAAGISFDAALDLLSGHAPAWLSEDGEDDGKFAGGELERHLWLAWSKLPHHVPPADDFDEIEEHGAEEEAETEAKSPPGVMKQWVWIADASKFIRRKDLKQFKPDQWNSLYAGLEPDGNILNKVWKGKTPVRRFEGIAYLPGRAEVTGGAYNIWRPSRIEPAEGDVSVIERHLELMFPDPVERGHVLDFMHFVCVKPEVKLQFAMLIQGAQGTGKTALGVLMKRIIGAANVVEPSQDELRDKWTKWQEGASLGLIEELMMEGRLALANKLKLVITNETLRIEDKGAPLYSIPNHLNLWAFSNHKNAVRLEEGDRRWLVLFSPMEPQDDAYYECLFRFIEGPGPARWLQRLMRHEPKLNPKGRAPETDAKLEMREASLTNVEATVREWKASSTGPMVNELFRFEEAWAALDRSTRPHKAALTAALKGAGCVQHVRQSNANLPRVALWSCRDHEKWEAAGPAGRTKAWMEMEGIDGLDQFNELMA